MPQPSPHIGNSVRAQPESSMATLPRCPALVSLFERVRPKSHGALGADRNARNVHSHRFRREPWREREIVMSFEETSESFIWTCDDCQLVAEFPPLDFYRSLAELKARGWRMRMVGEREGWMNY